MPVILIGDGARAMVCQGVCLSFGTKETIHYSRSLLDPSRFVIVQGDKNAHCYYPKGVGETS